MTYLLISVLLILSILLYFRVAGHFNIVDKPNQRSSHSSIIIRGGGVVFPMAVLLWFVFFGFENSWIVSGVLLISTISFLDDLYTLSTKPRLAVHLICVALLMYGAGIFAEAYYWWLLAFILIIGWINAFNFMDGINGITALYGLASLAAFYIANQSLAFVDSSLILSLTLGVLVFAFFNVRGKARTFAGDVGSVSLAFTLAFFMVKLILSSGRWEYILFFSVYGVDAIGTIIHRLTRRENIFKAHRSHLYQYLANEMAISQVYVSSGYAALQMLISIFIIWAVPQLSLAAVWAMVILILLSAIYILSKAYILKKLQAIAS